MNNPLREFCDKVGIANECVMDKYNQCGYTLIYGRKGEFIESHASEKGGFIPNDPLQCRYLHNREITVLINPSFKQIASVLKLISYFKSYHEMIEIQKLIDSE